MTQNKIVNGWREAIIQDSNVKLKIKPDSTGSTSRLSLNCLNIPIKKIIKKNVPIIPASNKIANAPLKAEFNPR